MIRPLSLAEIAAPLGIGEQGGDSLPVTEFNSVSTDTRSLQPGDLFVALRGERFDAHDYLDVAAARGACALIVEQQNNAVECLQLRVADSVKAYGQLAQLNRREYSGPLVALTGSSGKTTTKELLATILAGAGRVHVTQGNLNNHIGVPQTLLALPSAIDFVIIEMGASGPGEIDYLAGLAQPTVALVNNVMAAHLQGFGSESSVAHEKSRIYQHLQPGGTAVINAEEKYARGWCSELSGARPDIRQLTFSITDKAADVHVSELQLCDDGRYRGRLHYLEHSSPFRLPLLGRSNVANALAASACCVALGQPLSLICAGLQKVRPVAGRLNPLHSAAGALLIDDTYNANPGSVMAAVQLLCDLQSAGREPVLVLGDLAELGEGEIGALMQLGEDIRLAGLSLLLTCGDNSRFIGEGFLRNARSGQQSRHFSSQQELAIHLREISMQNSALLVKGSRSARMERVVEALAAPGSSR